MFNYFRINNLQTDKLSKIFFRYAIPSLVSLLIAGIYSVVDQIFIGNSSLGYVGLAATGLSFPLIILAQAFIWWVGDGVATKLALNNGSGNTKDNSQIVGSAIIFIFVISLLLGGGILIFVRPLLTGLGADNELTLSLAVTYTVIIVSFFPFYMTLNMLNPIIRADNSPVYALVATGIGAILNIALDPLFLYVFDMGIAGVAWATALSWLLSFAITIIYLFRSKTFHLKLSSFKFSYALIRRPLRLGLSSLFTHGAIVVMSLFLNKMLAVYSSASYYDSDITIAVMSVISKVFTFLVDIVVGIALGLQPVISYNYGAKNYKRVKIILTLLILITLIIGLLFTITNEINPSLYISMFGSYSNESYYKFATLAFRIYLMLICIPLLIKVIAIFYQAISESRAAIIASIMRDIVFFIPLVVILCATMDNPILGLLISAPIADMTAGIVAIIIFFVINKKYLSSSYREDHIL